MRKKILQRILCVLLLFGVIGATLSPAVAPQAQTQGNDHPIVLVHGLGGWGPGEMLGFRYWGGLGDIPRYLNNRGFRVYEANVSGWGSNRNRAIELYFFIKGGTVDYGAAHALRHGQERFGATFPGILPDWDENNKVHLIGHSMGGLTARALANLIAEGCAIDREFYERHPESGISSIFLGAEQSIHSITTVGTPHNGATFADDRNAFIHFARDFTLALAALSGVAPNLNLYDLGLAHYGLSRRPGESFLSYVNRVFNSPVWQSDNIALFCLSLRGIAYHENLLATRPDIFYFSHTAQSTERIPLTNNHRPLLTTNPIFMLPSIQIIRDAGNRRTPIANYWAPNDGIVSVVSSRHPFNHPARPYCGRPQPGEWNIHPTMMRWDHLDIIGIGTRTSRQVNQLYWEMAQRVRNLPA